MKKCDICDVIILYRGGREAGALQCFSPGYLHFKKGSPFLPGFFRLEPAGGVVFLLIAAPLKLCVPPMCEAEASQET